MGYANNIRIRIYKKELIARSAMLKLWYFSWSFCSLVFSSVTRNFLLCSTSLITHCLLDFYLSFFLFHTNAINVMQLYLYVM